MASSRIKNFVEFGRKIVCVGRNYSEHAKELGNEIPTKPLLFLKPTTSYVKTGGQIQIPPMCKELHHEVELAVIIGEKAKNIEESKAMSIVAGYTVALDMTARDLQSVAKKAGHPWTEAKCWDTFCPIGDFVDASAVPDPQNVTLWCKVNGETRQNGNTKDMIFSVPKLISHISTIFTLEPGDVILTGTPQGVGPVSHGDVIAAGAAVGDKSFAEISLTLA